MVLVEYVKALTESKHTTPARIALAWLLAQKPRIVPIPGTKHIERIAENIGAADIRAHLDSIDIAGGRYPADQEALTEK